MLESARQLILSILKIPPEPEPPAGAPGSVNVFRAAPNFYRLRLLRWGISQVSAVVGLVIALVTVHGAFVDNLVRQRAELGHVETVVYVLEAFGVVAFLVQLPFTFLATRLDFELRWYLVTDRSLRIRAGIWTVEELTMTFANIQELTIHQGPLQRILGIADLKVRSAGGGGSKQEGSSTRETHVALFHGVDNATFIRDLIVSHMRRHRDTGLGDPDAPVAIETGEATERLKAAEELLAEARALRAAFEARAASLLPAGDAVTGAGADSLSQGS